MSLRSVAQTPGDYIAFGAQHPEGLTSLTFGAMIERHFETMGESAARIFLQFYQASRENQNLGSTFYAAVKRSFAGLKNGKPSASRRSNDVMGAIVSVAEGDDTLATYIRRDLTGNVLPALLGTAKASPVHYQLASDILTITGQSKSFADCVDPAMAHRIVKWDLGLSGNDFTRAAEKLTALRASPPFAAAIDEIEDKAKVHVRSAAVAAAHGQGQETLVLRFEYAAHHVAAFVLHWHGAHAGID